MNGEAVFKTSAFGFNKLDVMNYINLQKAREAELLAEIEELKKSAKQNEERPVFFEKNQELEEAERHISVLRQEKDEIEQEKSLLIEKLQNSQESLIVKEEELINLSRQLDELKSAENKPPAEIYEDCPKDKDSKHLKDLESQLGSAIIDARRYSDRLVSEAKLKSTKIISGIYLAVNDTTSKVHSLSEEIESFKGEFEDSLRELTIKLESLSKNLDGTANDIIEQLEKSKADTDLNEV